MNVVYCDDSISSSVSVFRVHSAEFDKRVFICIIHNTFYVHICDKLIFAVTFVTYKIRLKLFE